VLGNELGRTSIPAGRLEEQFGGDNNGTPALSARVAVRRPSLGELGLSYYGGYYNTYRIEGLDVDEGRWLALTAIDLGLAVGPAEVRVEVARASIDVPAGMAELFGERQWGGHLDIVMPMWKPRSSGYPDAALFAGLRVEHVDFNVGTFGSTGGSIGDEITTVVPGIGFRPSAQTVIRANYRHEWSKDFAGNTPTRRAGVQVGIATYF
jgi:hypothetical protein